MPGQYQEIYDSPYQSQYVAAPIDELAVLGKTLDDKYQGNKALYDEDNLIHVNALDKDIPDRNKTLQGYSDQLAQTVKDNNGAYEKIGPQVSMITNRIHKDMTMGKLNAMEGNYKAANDYQKQINDEVAKGTITPDIGNKLIYEAHTNYPGVGDGGQNGIYTPFKGNMAAQEINPTEEAEKLFNGFQERSNKGESYGYNKASGEYGWFKGENSGFVKKDVKDYMKYALDNDPKYQASIAQTQRLNSLGAKYPTLGDFVDAHDMNEHPNNGQGNATYIDREIVANQLREQHPGYTDKQIIDKLDRDNFTNGVVNSQWLKKSAQKNSSEFEMDKLWEHNAEGAADKKDASFTMEYPGGVSNAAGGNLDNYRKGITDINTNLASLTDKLSKVTDPSIRQQLLNQKQSLENQKQMTTDFITSAAKRNGFDINNEYNNLIKQRPNLKSLSKEEFTKYLAGDNSVADFTSVSGDPSDYAPGIYANKLADAQALAKLRDSQDKAIKSSTTDNFVQTHDIFTGNDKSYVGELSKQLTEAVKNGNMQLLNEDGTIFDYKKQIGDQDVKPETITVAPTKEFIGGKPAYAVSAMDNKGKKVTYYTVRNDNTGYGDYAAIGQNLKEEATSSKYSSNPIKRQELTDYGNTYLGYSLIGRELQSAQIHTMTPGDSRELDMPSGKVIITANGDNNGKYYMMKLPNGTYLTDNNGKPAKFANETEISKFVGEHQ